MFAANRSNSLADVFPTPCGKDPEFRARVEQAAHLLAQNLATQMRRDNQAVYWEHCECGDLSILSPAAEEVVGALNTTRTEAGHCPYYASKRMINDSSRGVGVIVRVALRDLPLF